MILLTFTDCTLRSAWLHLSPAYILLHGDALPRAGPWWTRTLAEVPRIYHAPRVRPLTAPSGKQFSLFEHATDVARIGIVLRK